MFTYLLELKDDAIGHSKSKVPYVSQDILRCRQIYIYGFIFNLLPSVMVNQFRKAISILAKSR